MNVDRAKIPSPFTGEDASRSEAGEGLGSAVLGSGSACIHGPSPGRSLRSRPTSPVKGEGKGGVDREMRHRARSLRVRMTDAERKLWFALRDRRFAGFKFRRQVPIGHFIADFVCFERRLVIEVDGGQHTESATDQRRDRWFAANGFRVMRFWNNEVLSNLEGVMTVLAGALRVKEWS
jgi:very-short-patch-repair endonuclease